MCKGSNNFDEFKEAYNKYIKDIKLGIKNRKPVFISLIIIYI